jgi:hypothetical protein
MVAKPEQQRPNISPESWLKFMRTWVRDLFCIKLVFYEVAHKGFD